MSDLRTAPLPPLSETDHLRGEPAHPLVIVYSDFTCPRCVVAHARLRDSDLRVAYRHFALRARHPRALPLACAAEAAGLQGRFWEMCDSLFADPGRIDDPHLWARAEKLGLDVERFDADRRSPLVAGIVERHVRDGIRAGVSITPTLFSETRAPDPVPGVGQSRPIG
jgi:protein-disulfide isomerase